MNEKLPIPCERCHGSGLFVGLECEECRGKGYRLSIDGTPVPARDVRPAAMSFSLHLSHTPTIIAVVGSSQIGRIKTKARANFASRNS